MKIKNALFILSTLTTTSLVAQIEGAAIQAVSNSTRFELNFDCMHDFNKTSGATQDCIQPSRARLSYFAQADESTKAYFEIDPFASTSDQFDNSLDRTQLAQIRDTDLRILSAYGVKWKIRSNLSLTLGTHRGYVTPYFASQLPKSGLLMESPWQQTALALNYDLPIGKEFQLSIAFGNGEGESFNNLDPQQYVGIGVQASFGESLKLRFGGSFDGNNNGSEMYHWQFSSYDDVQTSMTKKGFSTQRLLANILFEPNHVPFKGISTSFFWQRTLAHDLDKTITSSPFLDDYLPNDKYQIDPSLIVMEDPSGEKANTLTRDLFQIGLSYRVLDFIVLGADYNLKNSSSAVQLFEACESIATSKCVDSGTKVNKIAQSSIGVGTRIFINEKLDLAVEYRQLSYGDLYAYFNYLDKDNRATRRREVVFARLGYTAKL